VPDALPLNAFAPSVSEAKLPNNRFEKKAISAGPEGGLLSIQTCADYIYEARNNAELRGLAGQALMEANKPQTAKGQAQALKEFFHKRTVYAKDPPGTEMIVKPQQTFCLPGSGICMPAGDCDDACVAYGALCMAAGLDVYVVGQAFYGQSAGPSHVIVGVGDPEGSSVSGVDGKVTRVDPTENTWKVGQAHKATKEWWIDPMSPVPGTARAKMMKPGVGDFVGVGRPPVPPTRGLEEMLHHSFPAPDVVQLDVRRQVEKTSGLRHVWIGTGQGAWSSEVQSEVEGTAMAALRQRLEDAVDALTAAKNKLYASLQTLQSTRLQLRVPNNLFDPEPTTPVTSLATFPKTGIWSSRMDQVATQVYAFVTDLETMGRQALAGDRALLVDQTNTIYLEALSTDPWNLHVIVETAENVIVAFVDAAGNILSGMDLQGNALTAAEVQAAAAGTSAGTSGIGTSGGVPRAYLITAVAGLAVVGLFAYYIGRQHAQAAATIADNATDQSIVACIQAGNCPPGLLLATQKNRLLLEQARAQTQKANDPLANLGVVLKWAAIGGIVAAGGILLWPLLSETVGLSAEEVRRVRHRRSA